jgi:hypothetical protein
MPDAGPLPDHGPPTHRCGSSTGRIPKQSGSWRLTGSGAYLTVEDSVGPGYRPRYSVVSTTRAAAPAVSLYAPASSAHTIADLLDPSNGADYVIVSPPAFLAAAESLVAYRSLGIEGIPSPRVRIATTERVFAQQGAGLRSPMAIRNLMAYASAHGTGPPRAISASWATPRSDPKNYIGFGTPISCRPTQLLR